MKIKMKERDLSKAVVQFLQYEENKGNLYFLRNNSFAGKIQRANGSSGWIRNNKKGTSDLIIFFPNGKTQFWELKSSTGKQSEDQASFEIKIGLLGFRYYLITEFSQAERIINEKGP